MNYWICEDALCRYIKYDHPYEKQDDDKYKARWFVRREYVITLYRDDATKPSTTSVPSSIRIPLTNGTTQNIALPSLSASSSGTAYVDYINYPSGGTWRVTEAESKLDIESRLWISKMKITGSWNKYRKITVTDPVVELYQ